MKRIFLSLRLPSLVVVLLVFSAFLFFLGFKEAQRASAAAAADCSQQPRGRCLNVGYFTGALRHTGLGSGNDFVWPNYYNYTTSIGNSGLWVYPSNVDNNQGLTTAAENFINYHWWALNQPYCGPPFCAVNNYQQPAHDQRRLSIGSAWVIATMLDGGHWGTDFGCYGAAGGPDNPDPCGNYGVTFGIQWSKDNFNRWADLVRAYARAGQVTFNGIVWVGPHLNTTSVGGGYTGRDVDTFWNADGEIFEAVIFTSANGSQYTLNKTCLNGIGLASLTPPATIQGRIFVDDGSGGGTPGDGVRNGAEPFVQNGVSCAPGGSPKVSVPGTYVTVSGIAGNYPPQFCNGGPPNTEPYYSVLVATPGNHTVSVVPPGGWLATTNPVTVNVQNGQIYDYWFGIRPLTPTVDLLINGLNNPPSVEQGDAITASWTTTNASSCSASGQWSGAKAVPNGSENRTADSATAGVKTYTLTCTNGAVNVVDTVSITVSRKPYLRVYGGDVVSGIGFDLSCTKNSSSQIAAYNRGSSGGYGGAGAQFGVQAYGAVDQFVSAMLRGSNPTPPKGLTFANTSGTYGASFGDAPCVKDYYGTLATHTSSHLPFPGGQDPDWPYNVPAYNYYQYNGNAILSAGTIQKGLHRTIYVRGNVYIAGPYISFDGGARTSLADIPSFYLIVQGNIYIDKGVTNLDGVYIAQPDSSGNGGIIYTCATGFNPVPNNLLYANCANKLTINGAFIANQVKFLRTVGSQGLSSASETSSSANIAEVFNFSPELWLTTPGLVTGGTVQLDSITSLPPIL